MTAIIYNPTSYISNSSKGLIVGLVLFVLLGALFSISGLPVLRQLQQTNAQQMFYLDSLLVSTK